MIRLVKLVIDGSRDNACERRCYNVVACLHPIWRRLFGRFLDLEGPTGCQKGWNCEDLVDGGALDLVAVIRSGLCVQGDLPR